MIVCIFYFLLALLPIMWMVSIIWLWKWKHIWVYAIANALLIFFSLFVTFFSSIKFFEHDEYGLKKVFLFLFILTFQTVTSFIYALYFKFKLSKNVHQQRTFN